MQTNLTQVMIGTAVAIGMSMVALIAIGSAVAHSPEEPTRVIGQKALLNHYSSPMSEIDLRLNEHQQLRGYFLDGSRDQFK